MFSISRNALRLGQPRAFTSGGRALKHTLPPLPYAYDALEPYISAEIMHLHHTKHHQTSVNTTEAAYASADSTTEQISLQGALKFNGGGHINHSLFWKNLAPASQQGGKLVGGGLLEKAIDRDFGSFDEFKKAVNAKTGAVQGSGWGHCGTQWVGNYDLKWMTKDGFLRRSLRGNVYI